jgi:hypothetical protein
MDRFGTEGREESRSGRIAGVALSLSLHAGVAWAAWMGLAVPQQSEPVSIAVRFVEMAPTASAASVASQAKAPEPVPAPEPSQAQKAAPEPEPSQARQAAPPQDASPEAEAPSPMKPPKPA